MGQAMARMKGARRAADTGAAVDTPNWHALPVKEVFSTLESSPSGLTSAVAAARLHRDGPNALTPPRTRTIFGRLWDQINNILIYILIIAAIISGYFREWAELGLIVAVIVINVAIGVIQEGKAEKAADAIKAMLAPKATVMRDGGRVVVDAVDIVRGDVVFFSSGDRIAADVRFFEASNLKASESTLTGESQDVAKGVLPVRADAPLGDRTCMGYAATFITAGSGSGVVVATSDDAEIGKINTLMSEEEDVETPILGQIETFGRWLSVITILVAIATFFIAWQGRGYKLSTAFETGVAVAVAIIPEGLPAVVTITLALGVQHMAAKKAIVRQLPAVETLGAVSVICSDKTGTLTKNEMTVAAIQTSRARYNVSGTGYSPAGAILCPDEAGAPVNDSTRAQLLRLLLPGALANDASLVPQARSEMAAAAAAKASGVAAAPAPEARASSASTEASVSAAHVHVDAAPAAAGAIAERPPPPRLVAQRSVATLLSDPDVVWTITGDPTEGALLPLVMKAGIYSLRPWLDSMPRLATIPFESTYKMMATLHDVRESDGSTQRVMLVKGAWDQVIQRCATEAADDDAGTAVPIDANRWLSAAQDMSAHGLRILAFAQRVMGPDTSTLHVEDDLVSATNLHLLCLVAIVDPPRPEVRDAIAECATAGIVVKMITGDHAETARYIASKLGITTQEVLTGAQVTAMTLAQLQQHVLTCNVFARASPENKIAIVKALRANGKIVSMTGDGVNDAPSLKAASVGVAMGITGTEVAKRAAKIILADDNFTTIKEAVREGRAVYDNLRKLLLFTLPTSNAQGLSISTAIAIGMPSPLTAIQTLTVNMVTSVTLGMVLALEKPEPDVMKRPPRDPQHPLLDALLAWRTFFVTILLIVAMLGNLQWQLAIGGTVGQGRAAAMTTLVIGQCLYVVACRSVYRSALTPSAWLGNPWLTGAVLLNVALQCLLIYTPGVQDVWDLEPIDGLVWLRILMLAFVVFLIVELEKVVGPRYVYRLFASCPSCRTRHDPLEGIIPVSAAMTGLHSSAQRSFRRSTRQISRRHLGALPSPQNVEATGVSAAAPPQTHAVGLHDHEIHTGAHMPSVPEETPIALRESELPSGSVQQAAQPAALVSTTAAAHTTVTVS